MVKHCDHVTAVAKGVEAAQRFFGLLGFEENGAASTRAAH